jgi:hypothetical protein
MTVEWFFNSITFESTQGFYRMLWVLVSYLPMQLFAYDLVEEYPYGVIDLSTGFGWLRFIQSTPTGLTFYILWAYITNMVKDRVEVSLDTFEQIQDLL